MGKVLKCLNMNHNKVDEDKVQMRIKLMALTLMLLFVAIAYGDQITLQYNLEDYVVNWNSSRFGSLEYGLGRPEYGEISMNEPNVVDSIIVVMDKTDSLYVFVNHHEYLIYCLKQNGEYTFMDFQSIEFDRLDALYHLDINKDGTNELVSIYTDIGYLGITIQSYHYEDKSLSIIFEHVYDPSEENPGPYTKIRHGKLYMAYGSSGKKGPYLKYGVLDYTRDKTREIYFRPISITTPEKWVKF